MEPGGAGYKYPARHGFMTDTDPRHDLNERARRVVRPSAVSGSMVLRQDHAIL